MWQDPHYADGAYAIIGRALESVVGMSYEDYVTQHIFKPLGRSPMVTASATAAIAHEVNRHAGMDSSFLAYDSWSDMAKRVPPGRAGNITFPSFISLADLNWARPTGNVLERPRHNRCWSAHHRIALTTFAVVLQVYSTVKDLAKLASLFMVGQDERKNVLGIYSSTLREMLTPSFINDDQVTSPALPLSP